MMATFMSASSRNRAERAPAKAAAAAATRRAPRGKAKR
jgi:hypothetical protein